MCMKTRTHLYVSRKNVLTWLMALCMVASAVARIVFPGLKGSGDTLPVWSQILLPIAATTLFACIALFSGDEFFYKTAIPVWMMVIYSGLWISENVEGRMMVWLFWIALIFFATLYTDITSGHRPKGTFLLLPVVAAPLVFILYFCKQDLLTGNYTALLPFLADILMLAGVLEGEDGDKKEHRPQTYARVQEIHRRFVERNGTVSCAELLGRAGVPEDPTPEERTPEYYAKRPCARVIASACQLIDEMLEENTHA